MKLIIVESPTKAKTISKFLDAKEYVVESSFGHVRDLPKSKIGVDIEHGFTPAYVIPDKAEEKVKALQRLAKKAEEVLLATDEDREGEAIAWHLQQILPKGKPTQRITFHEITKGAILAALEHPRDIDQSLVDAQQARRIVDRLVGYELSPFLWQKVQYGLSAGRVQSVAMRLIVERERERQAFDPQEYWSIEGIFTKDAAEFPAKLQRITGDSVGKLDITNEAQAHQIMDAIKDAIWKVTDTKSKEVKKAGPTPFTTSSLQIEANSSLSFSARQTMTLAQKLYETGHITYMRTDSLNLSKDFLASAQEFLKSEYGDTYATGEKTYKTKSRGAQEAHEAIRVTNINKTPDSMRGKLRDQGQWKLYDLIWRRSLASQMPSAILQRTSVDITANDHTFRANGSSVVFDGYMKVYRGSQDKLLPALTVGDTVSAVSITPEQHFTEPPARYSDATLVKALEEHGIGRPSTYAPTIGTIVDRGYIDRDENKKLYPLDIAFIVNDLLVEHFPDIVNLEFTATMEQQLDDIADGKTAWSPVVQAFYTPFHANLEQKNATLSKEDVMKERVVGTDPTTQLPIIVRNGRFGPFVQLGEWSEEDKKAKINKPKSTSLMKGMSIDTLTLDQALELLILPRLVGQTAEGNDIIATEGRFGPYVTDGETSASLGTELNPRTVDLETVQQLLIDAKEKKRIMMTPIAELGIDAKSGKEIVVRTGRYGPYVTDGEINASITKKSGLEPAEITMEQALELLAKKRANPSKFGRFKKTGKKK